MLGSDCVKTLKPTYDHIMELLINPHYSTRLCDVNFNYPSCRPISSDELI